MKLTKMSVNLKQISTKEDEFLVMKIFRNPNPNEKVVIKHVNERTL